MLLKYLIDDNSGLIKFSGTLFQEITSDDSNSTLYLFEETSLVYKSNTNAIFKYVDVDATKLLNPYWNAKDFWRYTGYKPQDALQGNYEDFVWPNVLKIDKTEEILYFQSGWSQDFTITIPNNNLPFIGMMFGADSLDKAFWLKRKEVTNELILYVSNGLGSIEELLVSSVDLAGQTFRGRLVIDTGTKPYLYDSKTNKKIQMGWKTSEGLYGQTIKYTGDFNIKVEPCFVFFGGCKLYQNKFYNTLFNDLDLSDPIVSRMSLAPGFGTLASHVITYNDNLNLPGDPENVQDAIASLKSLIDNQPIQTSVNTFNDLPVAKNSKDAIIHVVDASDDPTITSGWAKYQSINDTWVKYISLEDLSNSVSSLTKAQLEDVASEVEGTITGKVLNEILATRVDDKLAKKIDKPDGGKAGQVAIINQAGTDVEWIDPVFEPKKYKGTIKTQNDLANIIELEDGLSYYVKELNKIAVYVDGDLTGNFKPVAPSTGSWFITDPGTNEELKVSQIVGRWEGNEPVGNGTAATIKTGFDISKTEKLLISIADTIDNSGWAGSYVVDVSTLKSSGKFIINPYDNQLIELKKVDLVSGDLSFEYKIGPSSFHVLKIVGYAEKTITKVLQSGDVDVLNEPNLISNREDAVPTQKSVKTYIDNLPPSIELLNEDDLASDSETQGATQQSIKTYVDSKVRKVAMPSSYFEVEPNVDYTFGQAVKSDLNPFVPPNLPNSSNTFDLVRCDHDITLGSSNNNMFFEKGDIPSNTLVLKAGNIYRLSSIGNTVYFINTVEEKQTSNSSPITLASDSNPALTLTDQELKLVLPDLLDEDDLTSNSEAQAATQQSIKTYVDNRILRGAPVNTVADLQALDAKEYELRQVKANGREYVFEPGVSGTGENLDANNGTGAWIYKQPATFIDTIDSVTDLDNSQYKDGDILRLVYTEDGLSETNELVTIGGQRKAGSYEFVNAQGATLFANKATGELEYYELEDGEESINTSLVDIQNWDKDISFTNSTFRVRRKQDHTTAVNIIDGDGTKLTIAIDDFDWHEFKRIDYNKVEYLGKPFNSVPNVPTTESDVLLGQTFFSTTKRVKQGLCYAGETYQWVNNSKLKQLFDAEGHNFITDNGDGTFTVVNHTDFIRAGVGNIGTHVDDTTAVNSLSASSSLSYKGTIPTLSDDSTTESLNGNGSLGRKSNSSTSFSSPITATTSLTGDSETAPNHRTAYFGIYGDIVVSSITKEGQIIDEDDMASNSDTAVPTQQSVKAYVDAKSIVTVEPEIVNAYLTNSVARNSELRMGVLLATLPSAGVWSINAKITFTDCHDVVPGFEVVVDNKTVILEDAYEVGENNTIYNVFSKNGSITVKTTTANAELRLYGVWTSNSDTQYINSDNSKTYLNAVQLYKA